jgi:NADH-quinone oxidoreductase subunit E
MVWESIDIRTVDTTDGETLSDQTVAAISALFDRYPTRRAALLPALHLAQEQIGYLPPRALEQVAELFELSPAEVLDVVTFYEMYWQKPRGRKLVQICRSISCELCGQLDLTEAISSKLGIGLGETTEDGEYSFIALECLGACDKAPVMLVNETLHENVSAEELDEILGVKDT